MSRIFKFIGTILIGKILQRIVDWMSDPKNEGKLDAIGNFLKVTWPAILGAFLIFATGFGGIITTLIAMVGKFIPKIAATIARLAASNPLAAAAIALPPRVFEQCQQARAIHALCAQASPRARCPRPVRPGCPMLPARPPFRCCCRTRS